MVMKIPLMKPFLDNEILHQVSYVLKNERFLRGKSVEEFEKEFAKFIGTKYAIAVNSGTSALYLSLIAMGIKKGDLVITTPETFIATANAILYVNAKPLFADISLETYNIDPQKIEILLKKYKKKVKAIIPVHLYGYPCEMDAILEIAEKYDVKVLEDACQAHGATYNSKRIGSFGIAGAFSFYPSKNMTVCGDGGMITTNDDKIAEITMMLRDVGRSQKKRYLHEYIGYTARMNTINAAIGRVQLRHLEEWNEKRRKIAEEYSKKLQGIGDIILPPKESNKIKSAWHLYVIRTKYRDKLKEYLECKGIQCGIHYPIPVHLQPPYRKMGFSEGMYPNAERLSKEILSIPIYPSMSKREIEYVITNIEKFYEKVIK